MSKAIKIIIIGDFNFTNNAHHATNLAIEHSASLLNINVNYYWMRTHEAAALKPSKFNNFHGVIIAPGPYDNAFFLDEIIKSILASQVALLITGESFKTFLELIVKMYNLNLNQEKVISGNLASENNFEKVEVQPVTKSLISLYNEAKRIELTNARFSIYPQILEVLKQEAIDVEATNHFEEAEIISLKSRPFCVASMSLPQVCSTKEAPHPLISGFLSFASNWQEESKFKKQG
ncbi:CTP synthase [Brumimicrobium oceani]|uniref:CobB/CobQ-like glutamine amidotransferase domain-containing protein n=1 Tax=Brumimicrobium oceani TaxID=2100725 RepID=A0A2U2XD55_9FLAO|nr:hypothetical protein [Brumimicrobium oceani]PWH85703.1 hypothetical protein DIT68_08705 [Brumimicrobium oceani]